MRYTTSSLCFNFQTLRIQKRTKNRKKKKIFLSHRRCILIILQIASLKNADTDKGVFFVYPPPLTPSLPRPAMFFLKMQADSQVLSLVSF